MSMRSGLEDSSDCEDEADWDEASRRGLLGQERTVSGNKRSLCPECYTPLERVADLDAPAFCFACYRPDVCERCEDPILVGSLHFECAYCDDVKICTSCGPGVVIERHYDFIDPATGEKSIEPLPQRVQHKRSSGKIKRRGVKTSSEAMTMASEVVQRVQELCSSVKAEAQECYDKDWCPDVDLLQTLFGASADGNAARVVTVLAAACTDLLAREPSLNEVAVPCSVFGDLHGQFRDMLCLFNSFGAPWSCNNRFVFNGDFVDRGSHQVEVIGVLLALKLWYPDQVFLNRGNHEDTVQNKKYGFSKACTDLGPEGVVMLQTLSACFNMLPLACRVGERVLVLHGGIGNGEWSLDDLRAVKRPLTHDDLLMNDMAYNILWSDPIAEDSAAARLVFGVHPSPRGKRTMKFGWNVTQQFCENNELDLIVRSHQAMSRGYGFDVMHDEKLMRVFSARDYEKNQNDGCVLAIVESPSKEGDEVLVVRAQVLRSLRKSQTL